MSSAITHDRSIQRICQATIKKGDTPDTNIFIVSTGDRDRDNDTLDPKGWQLTAYRQNPVILWGHAHGDLPIAKCTDIRVVNGQLQATVQWPPAGVYPFADTVKEMARHGFVTSTSVGFRGNEWTPNPYGGKHYSGQELLEISLVPIPSNPNVRMEKGVDPMRLKSWLGHNWQHHKEDHMYHTGTTREDRVARQLAELFLGQGIDIIDKDDDPYQDPVDAAWQAMLATMHSRIQDDNEYRMMMEAQLSLLGPKASIEELCQRIMRDGVVAPPKRWRGNDLIEIDDEQLAGTIAQVIAEEIGTCTRSALNAALGRLD